MRRSFSQQAVRLAEAKLGAEAGSLEHALAVREQGVAAALARQYEEAGSVLLHAASLLRSLDPAASLVARNQAAHSLLRLGSERDLDAVRELRDNVRLAKETFDDAAVQVGLAHANLGRAQLLVGKLEEASESLQLAMLVFHKTIGHSHPQSHNVQCLWATCELTDWTQEEARDRILKQF